MSKKTVLIHIYFGVLLLIFITGWLLTKPSLLPLILWTGEVIFIIIFAKKYCDIYREEHNHKEQSK